MTISATQSAANSAIRSATYKEIMQQPAIWAAWATEFADEARAIAAAIRGRDITEIWLTGAGSSAYIGEIFAATCHRWAGVPVRAIPSTDIVARPQDYATDDPVLVVSFGRSGNSAETVGVLAVIDAVLPNAACLNITCNRKSALAASTSGVWSRTTILPEACHDAGFAMTSSFTTMLLTAMMVFQDGCAAQMADLSAGAARLLPELDARARSIPPPARAVFVGSGPLGFFGREAALKVMELAAGEIPALWDSCLGFRHGPKSFVLTGTAVFVFLSADPATRRYDDDLATEIATQFGSGSVVTIGTGGDVDTQTGAADGPDNDVAGGLKALLFAQLLSVHWSAALGHNVDDPFVGRGTLSRVVSGVTLYPVEVTA